MADNNAMRDPVEENNNNHRNENEQEGYAEVVVESTNLISIVDVMDSLTIHDSDTPANLTSLPGKVIRSISSQKRFQENNG